MDAMCDSVARISEKALTQQLAKAAAFREVESAALEHCVRVLALKGDVTEDDVKALVEACAAARDSRSVTEHFLHTLASMYYYEPSTRRLRSSVISAVASAMAAHRSSNSASNGCIVLHLLVADASSAADGMFRGNGGVDALRSAMRSFPADERIQLSSCQALHLILRDASPCCRHAMLTYCGDTVTQLHEAKQNHPENPALQESADLAIRILRGYSDRESMAITQCGFLRYYSSWSTVPLATVKEALDACEAAPASAAVAEALLAGVASLGAPPNWERPRLHDETSPSGSLFPSYQLCISNRVIPAVIAAFSEHGTYSASVAVNGCRALAALGLSSMERVLLVMAAHPENSAVQREAFRALRMLILDDDDCGASYDSYLDDSVFGCGSEHRDGALAVSTVTELCESRAAELIKAAADNHPGDSWLQTVTYTEWALPRRTA